MECDTGRVDSTPSNDCGTTNTEVVAALLLALLLLGSVIEVGDAALAA